MLFLFGENISVISAILLKTTSQEYVHVLFVYELIFLLLFLFGENISVISAILIKTTSQEYVHVLFVYELIFLLLFLFAKDDVSRICSSTC
jgi:uncharacterized membrane protein